MENANGIAFARFPIFPDLNPVQLARHVYKASTLSSVQQRVAREEKVVEEFNSMNLRFLPRPGEARAALNHSVCLLKGVDSKWPAYHGRIIKSCN